MYNLFSEQRRLSSTVKDKFEVLYNIYSGANKTQRQISTESDISLGKTNQIIEELINEGLIEHDGHYQLSKKGEEFLEKYRVDNAIIMAAGFGSRFVPMTYDTPKGLLEVKGERMIERQITQLHEVGITDITIVVGYLKEKFEYLRDKFGVKLTINPEYDQKNNISSIYHVQNELKNTYILPSDIYMEKNLFREFEVFSNYTCVYFEGETDEWTVTTNQQGLITELINDRQSDKWAIYGIAFFSQDFSNTIRTLTNHYYDLEKCAQWYWENVYQLHLKELPMYARKINDGLIHEFENIEELRVYDTSYVVSSRSEILDKIAEVFEVSLGEIKDIHTMKEGMTNDSFLFSIKGVEYVFRAPGKGTDLLIDRRQEYDVYQVITPLKISDDIVYLDKNNGYKIANFIHDSRTIDSSNKEELKMAMGLLKSFHDKNLKIDNEFNLEERIQFYLDLCIKEKAVFYEDFDDVHQSIQKVLSFVESKNRPKTLCHVDSVSANFLLSKSGITLLDWEYAGMADPIMDVAMFVIFDGLNKEEALEILNIYLQRSPSEEEITIFYAFIALGGFLWSLWTQYKQSQGELFGSYGMDQYRYARQFSKYVLSEGA